MSRYITRRVIQEATGVHLMTIQNWTKTPSFPKPVAIIGNSHLYAPADVYNWLYSHNKATPHQIKAMRDGEVVA